jgi:hypothetical protein
MPPPHTPSLLMSIVVSVSSPAAEDTIVHIFKRRMGLTKRGGYESDSLTVSSVSVNQTEKFTVYETHDFIQISVPTALILQVKVGVFL